MITTPHLWLGWVAGDTLNFTDLLFCRVCLNFLKTGVLRSGRGNKLHCNNYDQGANEFQCSKFLPSKAKYTHRCSVRAS